MSNGTTTAPIRMYGANWCPDCRRAKTFFGEQRVHYDYIDLDQFPDAVAEVEQINNGMRSIPRRLSSPMDRSW